MPRVWLGNPCPIWNGVATPDPNGITRIDIPECKSLEHMVSDIAHFDAGGASGQGAWYSHSGHMAPSWVVCDDNPELEAALAERFGCPAGRPDTEHPMLPAAPTQEG